MLLELDLWRPDIFEIEIKYYSNETTDPVGVLWEYSSRHYCDFVIDCLNADYDKLISLDDLIEKYKTIWKTESEHSDDSMYTEKSNRITILKENIIDMDLSLYKDMIKKIFLEGEPDSSLTAAQKFYAYSLAFLSKENDQDISFKYTTSVLAELSYFTLNLENIREVESNRQKGSDFIYQRIMDNLLRYPQAISPIHTQYTFSTFLDLFKYLFFEIIKNNIVVKKCPNCGKYFIPENRIDTVYCNRVSPQDPEKTCQEYAKYRNFLEKTRTDEATKLYRQIYNSKRNKAIRTDDPKITEDIEFFKKESAEWRSNVQAGIKTEEEFIEWLKGVKGKKVF